MSGNRISFFPSPTNGQKRDRSPSPSASAAAADTTASVPTPRFLTNLTFRPKPTTEGNHNAKRQRANPEANTSAPQSSTVQNTMTTPNNASDTSTIAPATASIGSNSSSALTTLKEPGTLIQRLKRKKATLVSPFIPQRIRRVGALLPQLRRRAPVFGESGLPLLKPDEARLAAALVRPQARIVRSAAGFPVAHVPNESRIVPPRAAKIIQDMLHCVCREPYDRNMIFCASCEKFFHPVCVGKGIYESRLYNDNDVDSSWSYMRDAQEWGKTRDFRCRECDKKAKQKPRSKKKFSWADRHAEQNRRARLFTLFQDNLSRGDQQRVCNHCDEQIIGNRYDCRFCESFDLCMDCYMDPAMSSLHKHSSGDMALK